MAKIASSSPTRPIEQPVVAQRTRGRPTHEEAVRLRRDFLQIALDAFLEDGYAGSSMDAIARRAKISKNTLYLHYRGKNELFRAAAMHGLANVRNELSAAINFGQAAETALLGVIKQVQAISSDPAMRGLMRLLIAESQRFPDIAAAMLDELNYMVEPVAIYLRTATERGEITVADPVQGALDIAMLAMGGLTFLVAEPPAAQDQLDARASNVLKMLLTGWRCDDGAREPQLRPGIGPA